MWCAQRRRYSLNAAIAVSPLRTVTLLALVAPVGGRHTTEYDPGFSDSRSDEPVPFEAPFTWNAHVPPTATASSVPLAPPALTGCGCGAGCGAGARLLFGLD